MRKQIIIDSIEVIDTGYEYVQVVNNGRIIIKQFTRDEDNLTNHASISLTHSVALELLKDLKKEMKKNIKGRLAELECHRIGYQMILRDTPLSNYSVYNDLSHKIISIKNEEKILRKQLIEEVGLR